MSETIYDKDGLNVTAFWGGNERGRSLQFTFSDHHARNQYVQIGYSDAAKLLQVLMRWAPLVSVGADPPLDGAGAAPGGMTHAGAEQVTTAPGRARAGPAPIVTPLAQGNAIDHPAHYGGKDDVYEAIKVIRAWELGFNLGNAVKYVRRAGRKPGVDLLEDLKKAAWYLNDEIADIEKRGAK